ncbi:putative oxidoreductase [Streptomyces sp. NBRC 110611]|nr:putative oxidoreductase [Streptomyces sp. NBRC 110611]
MAIEHLDINDPGHLPPLRERLAQRRLDVLFVNAGTTNNEQTPIGAVATADFMDVMVTNALGPLRVIEALEGLVSPAGLIGAMSSGQGSITNNTAGGREVYRGSKAALNMFLRSFAARQAGTQRAFVLMVAPGWIRTALGGPDAPFSFEETVPRLGTPGLAYLDRFGQTVPWRTPRFTPALTDRDVADVECLKTQGGDRADHRHRRTLEHAGSDGCPARLAAPG